MFSHLIIYFYGNPLKAAQTTCHLCCCIRTELTKYYQDSPEQYKNWDYHSELMAYQGSSVLSLLIGDSFVSLKSPSSAPMVLRSCKMAAVQPLSSQDISSISPEVYILYTWLCWWVMYF